CGAFVGMTSPLLFVTYWHGLIAGVLASVVFLLAQPVFHGIGGKLGTTAFVGATTTVAATTGTFHTDALPNTATIVLIVGYSIVGAVLTFAIHTRFSPTPVFASGVVGAIGGVLLPSLHGASGALIAAAVFSASFAGMSDPARLPDERWVGLSGVLVGLVFVYTIPYLGGPGGKLGTIAFGSCIAVHGLLRSVHGRELRRRLEEIPRADTT
ncbi:MAG: hypothetical protein ACQETB_00585, partial [Halobacteriota archaeon]